MANRVIRKNWALRNLQTTLTFVVPLVAGGAVSGANQDAVGMASITRTATGRYVVVLSDAWNKLLQVLVSWEGTVSGAVGAGKAVSCQLRNVSPATSNFTIQGLNGVTDAEFDDNVVLRITVIVTNSSV